MARGPIETPMTELAEEQGRPIDLSHTAMIRQGRPEEVAVVISWLLGDTSKFVTDTAQAVHGGWMALLNWRECDQMSLELCS